MYKAFDSFLDVDTWHTRHANDEERFFKALKKVVEDPHFHPEAMAEYMRTKLGVDPRDDENDFNEAIDHYTDAAWAVKSYLKTLGK